MLISEAVARAAALTGQALDQTAALNWLSELDGRICLEALGTDAPEPYTAGDLSAPLAVGHPWDALYVPYLEAMTCYAAGEYDRYQNARAMFEKKYRDFRSYLRRTRPERMPCPPAAGAWAAEE